MVRRAFRPARAARAWVTCLALGGCRGEPLEAPWCADAATGDTSPPHATTWHDEIAPLVEQKCGRCHTAGSGRLPLTSYADVVAGQDAVRAAVASRSMPPWMAAECCTPLYQNAGLTEDERSTLIGWLDADLPEGDAASAAGPRPPLGGLSRVDVTVSMPEPYAPHPANGRDETRCFLLDWPVT